MTTPTRSILLVWIAAAVAACEGASPTAVPEEASSSVGIMYGSGNRTDEASGVGTLGSGNARAESGGGAMGSGGRGGGGYTLGGGHGLTLAAVDEGVGLGSGHPHGTEDSGSRGRADGGFIGSGHLLRKDGSTLGSGYNRTSASHEGGVTLGSGSRGNGRGAIGSGNELSSAKADDGYTYGRGGGPVFGSGNRTNKASAPGGTIGSGHSLAGSGAVVPSGWAGSRHLLRQDRNGGNLMGSGHIRAVLDAGSGGFGSGHHTAGGWTAGSGN